jgi:hypothetical protein
MRLRLRGILPPDLQPNIDTLTHRQLVALRFASDAEMADLVRDVLAGKLATGKEIKMRIKSWQGDWLRGAFLWKWFVGPTRHESFLLKTPAMEAVIARSWGRGGPGGRSSVR